MGSEVKQVQCILSGGRIFNILECSIIRWIPVLVRGQCLDAAGTFGTFIEAEDQVVCNGAVNIDPVERNPAAQDDDRQYHRRQQQNQDRSGIQV